MTPLITALIIDYKRPEMTQRAVESIKNQIFKDIEIIVHDNSELNLGVAIPSNNVAKRSKAKYLFFLDNDAYLTDPDYINKLVKTIERSDNCAYIFGRVQNPDDSDQWIKQFNIKDPNYTQICYSFNGCGVLIRRDAFLKAGGYNTLFFAYYLESDLAMKFHQNNYFGLYTPFTLVHEQTPVSRDKAFANYLLIRNGYLFNLKYRNYPALAKRFLWGALNADFKTFIKANYDALRIVVKYGVNL